RQAADHGWNWAAAALRRQQATSFMHENNVRFLVSYIRTRYSQERARNERSPVAEMGSFATTLLRKKMRTVLARGGKRFATSDSDDVGHRGFDVLEVDEGQGQQRDGDQRRHAERV